MSDKINPAFGLREIAGHMQRWLDYQALQRRKNGLPCANDTHLVYAPTWLTRGQLTLWVKIMTDAAETVEPTARPSEEWHEGIGPVLWWKFPI
jgi:hypothetical protein